MYYTLSWKCKQFLLTSLFDLFESLVTEKYESDPSHSLSSSALNKTTKNLSYQHGTNRVRNLITRQGHNPKVKKINIRIKAMNDVDIRGQLCRFNFNKFSPFICCKPRSVFESVLYLFIKRQRHKILYQWFSR